MRGREGRKEGGREERRNRGTNAEMNGGMKEKTLPDRSGLPRAGMGVVPETLWEATTWRCLCMAAQESRKRT